MSFRDDVEKAIKLWTLPAGSQSAGGFRGAGYGADFENLILVSNKRYEVMDMGLVTKNHLRLKGGFGKKGYETRVVEKQTVDFSGYLKDVGHVSFDAKSTLAAKWRPKPEELHQLAYLLRGQRMADREHGRFFYLIERRWKDDYDGCLRIRTAYYLVENLERLVDGGGYVFDEADHVGEGDHGILIDYRMKLLETLCRKSE